MFRYLNAIFSHKLLILVPLILIPIISGASGALMTRSYEVTETIWVDSSSLLDAYTSGNNYVSPSQTEANTLDEWLGTRSFVLDTIDKTGMRDQIIQGAWPKRSTLQSDLSNMPLVGSLIQRIAFRKATDPDVLLEQATTSIRGSIKVDAPGTHVMKITYNGNDPDTGVKLLSAVVDLFNEKSATAKVDEANSAIGLLQAQVVDVQSRLDASSQAIQQFQETHPVGADGLRSPADEQALADLQRQYSLNRDLSDSLQTKLENAKLAGAAQLKQSTLTVADAAQAPKVASIGKKTVIMFVLIGLIVGLCIGLGLVLVMAWLDKSVRSTEDLTNIRGVPVLGAIPHLSPATGSLPDLGKDHSVRRFLAAVVAGDSRSG